MLPKSPEAVRTVRPAEEGRRGRPSLPGMRIRQARLPASDTDHRAKRKHSAAVEVHALDPRQVGVEAFPFLSVHAFFFCWKPMSHHGHS